MGFVKIGISISLQRLVAECSKTLPMGGSVSLVPVWALRPPTAVTVGSLWWGAGCECVRLTGSGQARSPSVKVWDHQLPLLHDQIKKLTSMH